MLNFMYEQCSGLMNGFFMSALIIVISVGAYFAFRTFYATKLNYNLNKNSSQSVTNILNEKFARGEISRKEYRNQISGRR